MATPFSVTSARQHELDLRNPALCEQLPVRDILDYVVRFGQGFLFTPPRPVRAEALHGVADPAKPGVDESPGALLAAS